LAFDHVRRQQQEDVENTPDSTAAKAAARTQEEPLPSTETMTNEVRMLLRWFIGLGLILGVWGIWQDLSPAFSFMSRVELWSYNTGAGDAAAAAGQGAPHAGPSPGHAVVCLSDVVFAIIAAIVTAELVRHGPTILQIVLLSRLPIDAAARFAITSVVRYIIVIVGVAVSFNAIGLGWARMQWLAAGITVGLGFGLQEIFANFVSGLIVLFERPVRIGDIVTVGGVDGKITRIRMRATTVTDFNRRELIVPNKEFITGQIINWTLSDPVTRVDIPIGIAYGSDTRLARDLLLQVAQRCEYVLDDPAPAALFKNFGDSTLDFELRVYIPNRDVWAEMIHELHTRIDDEFRRAGIEIAFPQQDIHIRSLPDGLPVVPSGQTPGSRTKPDSNAEAP
jgi:potassium-dependent mechanosensitive channel